jgi:hypothetical protein
MRHTVKLLGLALLAAVSVMALTAVAAQAEGELFVNKVKVGSSETAIEGTGTAGKGKLKVPGLGITFECEKGSAAASGGNLTVAHGLILVTFEECKVAGNSFCKVYPTAADRTAKTNVGKIPAHALFLWLKRLAGPIDHWLLKPILPSGFFTQIFLTKSAEGCTLPPENTVTGETAGKIPSPTTEATEHEIQDITSAEEATLTAEGMKVGLFYGAEPSELEGTNVKGKLTGTNLGKPFSVN